MTEQLVRNTATFLHPIHAAVNGRPVRILATGDQEGKSPVYLIVEEQGQSRWESFQQVRIIDTNVLPLGQDALSQLSSSVSGAGTRRS